jgi:hypothetical protein
MPSFSIRAYLPWSFHRDYRVSPFSASQLALAPTRTYKRRSTALQDHVSPVTKQTMAHPTSTADDVPLSQRLDGWTSYYSPKIGPVQISTSTRLPPSDFPSTSPFTYTSPFENARPIPSSSTWDRPLYTRGSTSSKHQTTQRQPQVITRDSKTLAESQKSPATTALTAPSRPDWRSAKGRTVDALYKMTEQRVGGHSARTADAEEGGINSVDKATEGEPGYKVW